MISASSLAFILVFMVLLQGLTAAVIGAIFYAALSRIPTAGWVKTGTCLTFAVAGAITFTLVGNVSGTGPLYIIAAIYLVFSGPLIILSPLFILAERKEYAPYTRYSTIIAALFSAAAVWGLIQALNITAFLAAGASVFPPAVLYLLSFAIMGGIQIVLGAEFFIFACALQRRREKKQGKTSAE